MTVSGDRAKRARHLTDEVRITGLPDQWRMRGDLIIEHEPATDRMVAEAVLARWTVQFDGGAQLYPYLAVTPAGHYFNRYASEREAWTAAHEALQERLETVGHP